MSNTFPPIFFLTASLVFLMLKETVDTAKNLANLSKLSTSKTPPNITKPFFCAKTLYANATTKKRDHNTLVYTILQTKHFGH
jgi:hypothetical protein